MSVIVKRMSFELSSRTIDVAMKVVEGYVFGAILRRTDQGKDMNGNAFAPYKDSYLKKLQAFGEDTQIDLRISGGLLNSLKQQMTKTNDGFKYSIQPDTGVSPIRLKRNKSRGETHSKTPHNLVAYYLQNGTPKMKARPFLGLTPDQVEYLRKAIQRAIVKK
jgi:hypothetical protein